MSRYLENICFFVLLIFCLQNITKASKGLSYTITKFWDNTDVPHRHQINLHLNYVKNHMNGSNDLEIRIKAPFYDDPKPPSNATVGSMDQLWNYEVVEVFLLGEDNHYLEIELGPKGHYLLLQLHGYRNVSKEGLILNHYSHHIEHNQWHGVAVIPSDYLPNKLIKFNAYAIHGSGTHRQYLSLFPTPFGKYKEPDFHRLEYFGDFQLNSD